MLKVDFAQLRALADAGGLLSVILTGAGRSFVINAETRRGEALLVVANARSRPRQFADPRRALLLLRELGIRECRVDTREWTPDLAPER